MPRKKKVVEKPKVVKEVKVQENPTLVEAREKLADFETMNVLLEKWGVHRLGSVVVILNQLRAQVAELEKI